MRTHERQRRTQPDRVGRTDRGAALITVAISLLMLFGIVAIAIDGGMGYNERRVTQGAADHAALAAAWAACNALGDAAAQAAGQAAAADNGYDDSTADVDVTVTRVAGSEARYEAVIRSTNATEFAGVLGADSMTVESKAVADCTRRIWGGGYALFAEGHIACTNNELDFTGGGIEVTGLAHSNGDLRINGNNGNPSTMNDLVTYVGSESNNGVIFAGGGPDLSSVRPDPFDIDFDQFLPNNNVPRWDVDYFHTSGQITNNWLEAGNYGTKSGGVITLTRSGIYYAGSEIKNVTVQMGTDINTGQPTRATFVSPGAISMNGEGDMAFYDPSGVALYSNRQPPGICGNNAIKWSSSSGAWTGLIYAPYGEVQMSMASGSTFNGAIMGFEVNLSGSNYEIAYSDLTGGGPEFELEFEE